MTQVDSSIYNNLQAPKIATPFENAAAMAQIQNGQNQNRLAGMQFKEAERKDAERNLLADAYRQSYNPDGTQDRNKLYSTLATGGQGQLVPGLQKQYNEADASGVDLENKKLTGRKAQIENAIQMLSATEQIMSGVTDQASYEAVLPQLRALHDPETAAKIPAVFDPAAIERGRAQAMPLKDRMEQEWKQLDYELNTEKFAYKKTHDAKTLAQQERTSLRTDTRARDLNAAKVEENRIKRLEKRAKPLPVGALKLRVESQEMADIADGINDRLTGVLGRIDTGKLTFGPIRNLVNTVRNKAGRSTEESRNFASFKAELEKLRNDSLRLNKGVQTDGDAQRAWNEILENINDKDLVEQRLGEVMQLNERAKNLRLMEVDTINRNYGAESPEPTKPKKPEAAKSDAYKEYLDAFNRATPEQRKAINARAKEMGVIK